jgi:hypothetical protein
MQNKQAIAIAIGYIYKFITVLYCSKKFYKFKQVSNKYVSYGYGYGLFVLHGLKLLFN